VSCRKAEKEAASAPSLVAAVVVPVDAPNAPPSSCQKNKPPQKNKDLAELTLPANIKIAFPEGKDKVMHFEITILPDEGFYRCVFDLCCSIDRPSVDRRARAPISSPFRSFRFHTFSQNLPPPRPHHHQTNQKQRRHLPV